MINIFHGDDYITSRQELNQALETNLNNQTEIIKLNAKSLTLESLTQTLESSSLFNNKKITVIFQLFSLPRSKNKTSLIELVLKNPDKTIYIWETKTLTPANLKLVSKKEGVNLKSFKLPVVLFKFLDSIKPENSKTTLNLFHQTLKTNPVELIFYMLSRRLSQLIQAKDNPKTIKAAPWQINQLKSQAKSFPSIDYLIKLHSKLSLLDYQTKTGQSPVDLTTNLDLLLINL